MTRHEPPVGRLPDVSEFAFHCYAIALIIPILITVPTILASVFPYIFSVGYDILRYSMERIWRAVSTFYTRELNLCVAAVLVCAWAWILSHRITRELFRSLAELNGKKSDDRKKEVKAHPGRAEFEAMKANVESIKEDLEILLVTLEGRTGQLEKEVFGDRDM